MSPYRASDDVRAVCIACYRYATRTVGLCPACQVPMTSATNDKSEAEVMGGLQLRANRRFRRPVRLRNALTIGGGLAIAVVVTVVLMSMGWLELNVPRQSAWENNAGPFVLGFWPTALLWIAFGALLHPLAKRLFPLAPPLPSEPATATALAEYLGITIVDGGREHPDKPIGTEHGPTQA